ncbi:MAG: ABC transporter ATP-binding protein [Armatimonadetes bacterium]|nr:ABC transporter ATP-binding protein [Armatimonadota bacterium]
MTREQQEAAGAPMSAATERPAVVVEHVYFAWHDEQWVLEDVNLVVSPGTFLGLIGPNGGGKTTLVRLILGELVPTRGRVEVLGCPAHRLGRRRALIGYLPQRPEIDRAFPATALEVTLMGLFGRIGLLRRVPGWARDKAIAALEQVGMAEYARRPISSLSGGQQQRVLIARAIVADPQLLLLDEPTVGVDTGGQSAFFELLLRLRSDLGLTIICVTHDLLQIGHYADRLACLHRTVHWHERADQVSPEEIRDALRCELDEYLAYDRQLRASHDGGPTSPPADER